MQPQKNLIFLKNPAEFPLNDYIHDILIVGRWHHRSWFLQTCTKSTFLAKGQGYFLIFQRQQLTTRMLAVGQEKMGNSIHHRSRCQEPLPVPGTRHQQSAHQQYLLDIRFGKDIKSLAHQSWKLPNHAS